LTPTRGRRYPLSGKLFVETPPYTCYTTRGDNYTITGRCKGAKSRARDSVNCTALRNALLRWTGRVLYRASMSNGKYSYDIVYLGIRGQRRIGCARHGVSNSANGAARWRWRTSGKALTLTGGPTTRAWAGMSIVSRSKEMINRRRGRRKTFPSRVLHTCTAGAPAGSPENDRDIIFLSAHTLVWRAEIISGALRSSYCSATGVVHSTYTRNFRDNRRRAKGGFRETLLLYGHKK